MEQSGLVSGCQLYKDKLSWSRYILDTALRHTKYYAPFIFTILCKRLSKRTIESIFKWYWIPRRLNLCQWSESVTYRVSRGGALCPIPPRRGWPRIKTLLISLKNNIWQFLDIIDIICALTSVCTLPRWSYTGVLPLARSETRDRWMCSVNNCMEMTVK